MKEAANFEFNIDNEILAKTTLEKTLFHAHFKNNNSSSVLILRQ